MVFFFFLVYVYFDWKIFQLNNIFKYKYFVELYSIGIWNYFFVVEVGLLIRNIVIKGVDDVGYVFDKQLFGSCMLISLFYDMVLFNRRVCMENVEFYYCGQEGWNDYFDFR